MKPLKYIIFFSILCGMFLIVYRNCDRKGLVRYWISFKMAILIAATLAGLIAENAEAVEPYGTNTNPSIERSLKISGGDQSKFGPGARAKADARRNAKGSGSFLIPGADGFVPSRNYRPYQKPISCRNNGKIKEDPFNQHGGGASSSMETLSRRLSPEYTDYQQKFNSPPLSERFDTDNFDKELFRELAKDPKAKIEVFHKKTTDEARTAIHAEMEGIVENPRLPDV